MSHLAHTRHSSPRSNTESSIEPESEVEAAAGGEGGEGGAVATTEEGAAVEGGTVAPMEGGGE